MGGRMTQKEQVLNHLKHRKYIDRAIAINEYGIFNLPDVVMKLRNDGWNIDCVEEDPKTGKKWNFGRYTLVKA